MKKLMLYLLKKITENIALNKIIEVQKIASRNSQNSSNQSFMNEKKSITENYKNL